LSDSKTLCNRQKNRQPLLQGKAKGAPMQTSRFKVVFSGVVYPGKKVSHVKRNLARLLEMDLEQIEALFETHGPVIRQSLDIATAISYAKVFEEAGAVCHVQAVSQKDADQGIQPGREEKAAAKSAPAASAPPAGRSIGVFEAGPTAQDDLYAPLACPRFTGADNNLGINRLDREQIPFDTIKALSVFGHQEAGEKKFTLFLFEKGQRRPLMVDASKIVFNDFEGVTGQMLLSSLRNFVGLVHQKNPNLIIDRRTYDFLSGQMPHPIKQDAHSLATGLGKALEANPALTAMPIPEQGILGALEAAWLELLEKEQALPEADVDEKAPAGEPAAKPFFKPEPQRVRGAIQGETVKAILSRRPTAPLGRRILASIQSLLLMGCLVLVLFIPADMFIRAEYSESIFQAFESKGTAWQAALSLIIGLPVGLVFFVQVLLQKKTGQTWGQKLAGIQVVHDDGSPAKGLDIWFVRFVGHVIMLMILGVNALVVGLDPRRTSLADSFSQTRQVKTKFRPGILWQMMPILLFMGLAANVFEYRARWESIPQGVMLWLIGVGMWLVTFFTYAAWRRGKDEIKTTG
jgi:uncharacterized RDD family membrane protein YckC